MRILGGTVDVEVDLWPHTRTGTGTTLSHAHEHAQTRSYTHRKRRERRERSWLLRRQWELSCSREDNEQATGGLLLQAQG